MDDVKTHKSTVGQKSKRVKCNAGLLLTGDVDFDDPRVGTMESKSRSEVKPED